MQNEVIYMVNDEDKTFFFSTDDIQEFENEELFVPCTEWGVNFIFIRAKLTNDGYKQIPNPDCNFVPEYNKRAQRLMMQGN